MQRINVVGFNTRHGYRTCELYFGDLSNMDRAVDVLVVSAFAEGYDPTPGSVIGALYTNRGVSVSSLSKTPAWDFRSSLGLWISLPLDDPYFTRLLCAELVGGRRPSEEVLDNVFVALSIMEAKEVPVRRVALSPLGTGHQRLPLGRVADTLIQASRRFLERSPTAETVLFVTNDRRGADDLADAFDEALGRTSEVIPVGQLIESVRVDLIHLFNSAHGLFSSHDNELKSDWLALLRRHDVRVSELGLLGRRLVELLVTRLGSPPTGPLYQRIAALEKAGSIAPWICGYMHVLRHLGNEAAHNDTLNNRVPAYVEEGDLGLALLCVERLIRFAAATRLWPDR